MTLNPVASTLSRHIVVLDWFRVTGNAVASQLRSGALVHAEQVLLTLGSIRPAPLRIAAVTAPALRASARGATFYRGHPVEIAVDRPTS